MGACQFFEVPGYSALLLRRTMAELKKSGALLDRSMEWFAGTGAKFNASDHRWRFPSGASLQFGFCESERDVFRYQSDEYQYIGVDEATHFTEFQIRYLFSRLRRRKSIPVPLRYRLASNPGNVGHKFIKARYITPGTPGKAFVPAFLADNPGIDRESYIQSLAELDPITNAQLLAGDWDAIEGGRFERDWFRSYDWCGDFIRLQLPDGSYKTPFKPMERRRFITCDPAASTSNAADYTVVSTWCVSPDADLIWLACDRFKAEIPDIVPRIGRTVKRWRPPIVGIETALSNRAVYQLACRHDDPIIPARSMEPGGRDKLVRASKFITLAHSGRVYLPAPESDVSFSREDVLSELVLFTGDDSKDSHDDIVDTCSMASELMDASPTQYVGFPRVIGGPDRR
jgi:predicted phage terminase large subunit-like protein